MRKLRAMLLMVVMATVLSACGVGLRTNDGSGSQLSEAEIRATVEAEMRATAAAQQSSAAPSSPAAGSGSQLSEAEIRATVEAELRATQAAASASSAPQPSSSASAQAGAAATETVPTTPASAGATETVPTPQASTQVVASKDALPPMLLILDSSGSMLLDDGAGQPKIAAAKNALNSLVDALPEGVQVGLRVYGHRYPNTDKINGCKDTELIAPVGPLNKTDMRAKINSFEAKGYTPISLSLEEGFKDLPPEGQRKMVLVSDGEETCERPPCPVAEQLKARGVDLVVETVGFQVDNATREQLKCIAEKTGGQYRDANSASELAEQLKQITRRAAEGYRTAGGQIQGGTSFNDAPLVPPGQYQGTIVPGETRYFAIEVPEGKLLAATATLIPPQGLKNPSNGWQCCTEAKLKLFDPQRADLFIAGGAAFKNGDFASSAVNVTASANDAISFDAKPGKYYVALTFTDAPNNYKGAEFQTEFVFDLQDK